VSWAYSFNESARKQLKKLGRSAQIEILHYLDERVAGEEDPRRFGKGLKADLAGLWRYRVGDYRILCQIQDHELIVLVVSVGHRREVYR
jgi:mRNA interferase RelE/StbE